MCIAFFILFRTPNHPRRRNLISVFSIQAERKAEIHFLANISRCFMFHSCAPRTFLFVLSSLCLSLTVFAADPIVIVTNPANNSRTTSPINYVASAINPDCPQGISAMRIYSAPHVSAFTGGGEKINTYISLQQVRSHV
jgi:hypothetical protein